MKKLLVTVGVIALVISSVSCSAPSSSPVPSPTPTPPKTTSSGAGSTSTRDAGIVVTPTMVYGPAGIPTPSTPSPTPAPGPTVPTAQQAADISARLIVRNGNMLVMVDDIKNAINQITLLTTQKKGFVVSSQIPPIEPGNTGSIVIRVPAEEFENTMTAISALAVEVKSQSTSANDVTQQYTDLNSRLTNLLATEQQFLAILGEATTVTDILAVQKELSNTRQDIEVTKGQIQYLQQTSSTYLISVTLQQSKLIIKIVPDRPLANVDEPVAFSVDVTGGFSPFSYQWDFGDKSTSTQSYPTHSYGSPGDYKVALKVTDNHGNVATDNRTMSISGGWSGGTVARSASRALSAFGKGVLDFLIWLGIFSPVWIIVGGIALFFVRHSRRKKKNAT